MSYIVRLVAFLFVVWCAPALAQNTYTNGNLNVNISGKSGVPPTIVITPQTTTPTTQAAGTVTTGGTFQTALAANASRTGCEIQNTSAHTAYVYWLATGTATTLNSEQVLPGGKFNCANLAGGVIKTLIQWTATTTADPYVVTENQ